MDILTMDTKPIQVTVAPEEAGLGWGQALFH